MTTLSQFKEAAAHFEALRMLRRFRQSYSSGDSPPQRAVLELDADHRPRAVMLSDSGRGA
jgi:hypothetical protein